MRFAYLTIALAACAGCYDPGDLGDTPYRCSPTYPECPDGYTCQLTSSPDPMNMNKCVRNAGGMTGNPLSLPAKTTLYTGTKTQDPKLMGGCPATDAGNDIGNPSNDANGGGQVMEAICPSGDVDVYEVDLSGEYAVVQVNFAISHGDIDLGLFDAKGNLVQYDNNSNTSVACVSTGSKQTATFYAGVFGAPTSLNCTSGCMTDTGSYSIQVTKSMSPISCSGGAVDMSLLPDLSF